MSKFIPNLGVTESEIDLPQYINIVNQSQSGGGNNSETSPVLSLTSTNAGMVGGNANFSATSSIRGNNNVFSATSVSNMAGGNGNYSATSDNKPTAQNVNDLVSMLTSESDNALSQTDTEQLESQLKGILKGGARNNYSNGSIGPMEVKSFFRDLKSQGVDVRLKLNSQSFDEFFGLNTTETFDMEGGNNPGFKAFLDLKKYIAEKLGVSNGPIAAKVAGAVQRETKEKNPDVKDGVKIAELAKENFNKDMEKYKKMI